MRYEYPSIEPGTVRLVELESEHDPSMAELVERATEMTRVISSNIEGIASDAGVKRALEQRLASAMDMLTRKLCKLSFIAAIGAAGTAVYVTEATAVVATGLAVNHEMARENISEIVDESGEVNYVHSDPTTNHILNYMSGKESLSEDERFDLVRQLKKIAWQDDILLPENYDTMSYDEFCHFYIRTFKGDGGDQQDFNKMLNRAVPLSFKYDQRSYELLWEIEKEVGAPNIRWIFGPKWERSHPRPYYSPLTNTIHMGPALADDDFFAEAAHAKQFRGDPISTYRAEIDTGLRVVKTVLETGVSFLDAYEKEYDVPGSIEQGAHQRIEPALREKFLDEKKISRNK